MAPAPNNVNKADIISGAATSADMPLDVMGLFFFAYRDFVNDADALLERQGFGRAHHRVLYFVNLKPGMPVADLLDILKITKQSLARVLKELIDSGYIRQMAGPADRRQQRVGGRGVVAGGGSDHDQPTRHQFVGNGCTDTARCTRDQGHLARKFDFRHVLVLRTSGQQVLHFGQ